MAILTTKKIQLNFNLQGRKNPATMKSNEGCRHFVMATDDNQLKQNNTAMLAGRP